MCSLFPLCAANISATSWCLKGCSQQRRQWSGLSGSFVLTPLLFLTETFPSTQSESTHEMRKHAAKFIIIHEIFHYFFPFCGAQNSHMAYLRGKIYPQIVPFSQYCAALGYTTHAYVAIQVCKTGRAPQAHFPLHQAGSPRAVLREAPGWVLPSRGQDHIPTSCFPSWNTAQRSNSTADHFTISLQQPKGYPNPLHKYWKEFNGENITHKPFTLSSW